MNRELTARNRKMIEEALPDNAICILFAGVAPHRSKDQQYPFSINRNFYYATGLDKEQMVLLITKRNQHTTQTLFIERPDENAEKWTGIRIRIDEAKVKSGIENIEYLDTFESRLTRELLNGWFEFLYLDLEQPTFNASPSKPQQFSTQMKTKYPYLSIHNIYPLFVSLRAIKTDYEVEQIRKAISITKCGIESLMASAKTDIMEYELEAEFDRTLKASGVRETAFDTIMAGGKRATVLHYVENNQKINANELVLADLGASWGHYSADITRTFPISRKFTERQKLLYEIVLKVQTETIAIIRPGITFIELNAIAKSTFARELKAIGLISKDDEVANYYYHSIGHSLGLDTHDVCDNSQPIQAGYVITVEPGLYIAEESIGIRIEDDILVTDDGHENLSKEIIKTVEEIESFFATANL